MPFGVDPKTVVCIFYKQGNCEKGKKCKFSHDMSVERKGEKKNLYQDTREGEDEAKKKDEMDNWDEGQIIQVLSHATFAGLVVLMYLGVQKNYGKSSSANMGIPKLPPTRSANTSLTPSKRVNMAGSGRVPTAAINACTSTACRLASC